MSFKFDWTLDKTKKILTQADNVAVWHDAIVEALPQYEITTIERAAAFMAQTAHESGQYKVLHENLNYSADGLRRIFGKYFTDDATASAYERKPEKIANRVYANRMGNGDEASGDGYKYRGRGLIQLTGKSNYAQCSKDMFGDDTLLTNPDTLLDPLYAIHSACWFWNKNNLNAIADAGDMKLLTKRINGGDIGLEDRIKHYKHALEVLRA